MTRLVDDSSASAHACTCNSELCLSVCLSAYLPVCLPVYILPVYLNACLSATYHTSSFHPCDCLTARLPVPTVPTVAAAQGTDGRWWGRDRPASVQVPSTLQQPRPVCALQVCPANMHLLAWLHRHSVRAGARTGEKGGGSCCGRAAATGCHCWCCAQFVTGSSAPVRVFTLMRYYLNLTRLNPAKA